MRYHKNTETLLHSIFQEKWQFFTRLRSINCTNWERTGMNRLDHLEEQGQFSPKRLNDISSKLKDMNFSREDIQNFSALRHLLSECNIWMKIAPN